MGVPVPFPTAMVPCPSPSWSPSFYLISGNWTSALHNFLLQKGVYGTDKGLREHTHRDDSDRKDCKKTSWRKELVTRALKDKEEGD